MKPKNPLKLDGARPLPEKALEALNHLEPSRRDFLKTAGVMMIGIGVGAVTADARSPLPPRAMSIPHRWTTGSPSPPTRASPFSLVNAKSEPVCAPANTDLPPKNVRAHGTRYARPVQERITPNQGCTVGSFSALDAVGTSGLRAAVDTARDALYQLASQWSAFTLASSPLRMACSGSAAGDPAYAVSYGELVKDNGLIFR